MLAPSDDKLSKCPFVWTEYSRQKLKQSVNVDWVFTWTMITRKFILTTFWYIYIWYFCNFSEVVIGLLCVTIFTLRTTQLHLETSKQCSLSNYQLNQFAGELGKCTTHNFYQPLSCHIAGNFAKHLLCHIFVKHHANPK